MTSRKAGEMQSNEYADEECTLGSFNHRGVRVKVFHTVMNLIFTGAVASITVLTFELKLSTWSLTVIREKSFTIRVTQLQTSIVKMCICDSLRYSLAQKQLSIDFSTLLFRVIELNASSPISIDKVKEKRNAITGDT
ncbi:hypothetical protein F2P81_000635 [Scophthalmus maximus]|uniref:Uncharacterized protein n=1 Tax=Scophthalmus maximus TaxID=52904 RepID=A0A6A4TY70_SCOMX|nr:hypothetical protein F2P81_000635 [Scophthalmus maximus]